MSRSFLAMAPWSRPWASVAPTCQTVPPTAVDLLGLRAIPRRDSRRAALRGFSTRVRPAEGPPSPRPRKSTSPPPSPPRARMRASTFSAAVLVAATTPVRSGSRPEARRARARAWWMRARSWVLPVPGGPHTRVTRLRDTSRTASSCEGVGANSRAAATAASSRARSSAGRGRRPSGRLARISSNGGRRSTWARGTRVAWW
mmetsp:Transcript_23066/g.77404  ORF Transcript_23066/g.77404 Transcript_23066/m.77404 type:complete len:201 (+) Transcript_23066:479-1081(+)